jgi:autotransporter-associated beta strand protein
MARWRRLLVGAAACALVGGEAFAQANVFWTGASSGADDFGNAANWLADAVPANNGTKILGFFSAEATAPNGNQMNLNVAVNALGLDVEADKASGGGANISFSSANADALTLGASGIEINQTSNNFPSILAIATSVILSANQTWTLTNSDLDVTGPISESSPGTKLDIANVGGTQSTITLSSGSSSFSGGLKVTGSAAVLVAGASTSGPAGNPTSGPVGTGTLTLGNGTSLLTTAATTATIGNNIVLGTGSGLSTVNLTGGSGGKLILTGVLSDPSSGTGAIQAISLGQLDLEGANTYSGGTTIAFDTVTIGNDNGLGTGMVTAANSTLNFTSLMPGSGVPSFDFSQVTANFTHASATVTLSSVFLQDSTLNFTQAGDEVMLNTPFVTTGSIINFGDGSIISISNMVSDANTSNQINLGNDSVLSMRVDAPNSTFFGTINGTGSSSVSFVTSSSGVMELSGANTYTGGTTIGNNVLVIADNNSAFGSGSISLNGGGASLGVASGVTIANPIGTFSNGSVIEGYGTVAPGSAFFLIDSHGSVLVGGKGSLPLGGFAASPVPGTLTFGANVANMIFGNQGSMQFSIMNATGTAGVDFSKVSAPSATVNITALPTTPFTIQLVSVNPATGQTGLANFNDTMAYSWTLLSAFSIGNFSANKFTIDDTTDFQNALGGGTFSISDPGGTSLVLSFTPVPEPSTWALMATGLGALGAAVRRRRR